jgi:hypothetical protein
MPAPPRLRSRPQSRWFAVPPLIAIFLAAALLAPTGALAQSSASDDTVPASFSGPCTAHATISSSGATVNPAASGGVYSAPISGSATYTGGIAVPAQPRAFNGKVWVVTPPGIPTFTLKSWSDIDGDKISDAGTVTWDLPDAMPRGVRFTVTGFHQETGVRCEGSIQVQVDGGFTDSPLGWVALALTALGAIGVLFAAMPKGGAR